MKSAVNGKDDYKETGGLVMKTKSGAAALSILSNSILVVLKLTAGLLSGAVSIISEAAHSATDLAASLLAFFSVRAAGIPADTDHPFGHGKIENVSGTVEALLIFAAAAWIIYEAIKRLLLAIKGLHPVEPTIGIIVMFISVVANYAISTWLFKVARETDSVALEADGYHLRTDVWTSLGVFAGLVAIKVTGLAILDPIIAILVALFIIKAAYNLTREAGAPLVDTRLPMQEIGKVNDILLSEPRIVGFHKLRTRRAGPEREIDLHIIVPQEMSLSEAHDLAEEIEQKIRTALGGAHVVTHVEPDTIENLRDNPPEGLAEDEGDT